MNYVRSARNEREKFDLQLRRGLDAETDLGEILCDKRIELKTESHIWEKTGNICVEIRNNGKRSGLAATEADHWVHELRDEQNRTLIYMILPMWRLRELAKRAWKEGRVRENSGDGGRSTVILVPIDWLTEAPSKLST